MIQIITLVLASFSFIINIVILFLVVSIKKNNGIRQLSNKKEDKCKVRNMRSESGIVFCRNCGNKYDSMNAVCPNCKTPR